MATTDEKVAELRAKDLDRQWIENYKRYRRLIKEAEAELAKE